MTTAHKIRSAVYQITDGVPGYIEEQWEIGDLSDRDMAAMDVLAAARVADPTFPAVGEERDGLPQRTMRVTDVAVNGRSRRVLIAWGIRAQRNGPSILTREVRSRVSALRDFVQPYFVLLGQVVAPTGGTLPLVVRRERTNIRRTRTTLYLGQIVGSQWNAVNIGEIVAQNLGKLYTIHGGPALLEDYDIARLPTNQLWVWTVFSRTGWVRGAAPGEIEDGSFEVLALPPLAEYKAVMDDNVLRFFTPTELYEIGGTLGWMT